MHVQVQTSLRRSGMSLLIKKYLKALDPVHDAKLVHYQATGRDDEQVSGSLL